MALASTIAICPPEYFPGLAFSALMQVTDIFVLADTFQYSRQSFQNRTRVRNAQSWQWVSVPLKGGQHGLPQSKTRIRQEQGWRKRHWKAFLFNYSATPFFEYFAPQLKSLYRTEWDTLSLITCQSAMLTHQWLNLESALVRASELPGQPATVAEVRDCLPANALVSRHGIPESGASMELVYDSPQYRQSFAGFQSGMCTLDLLFNYGPESGRILRSGARIVRI